MFFYTFMPKLLNMSLTAGVAIVFVMLLRLLLKKAPKVFSYALWAIVLFRLLCPVSVESGFSLYNLIDAPAKEAGALTSAIEYVPEDIVHTEYPTVVLPVPGVSEVINDALPQGREQQVADPMEAPMSIATYVWMAGVLVLVIYSIVSYIRLHRKLRVTVPLRDNIYIADDIRSPFVIGLIRPKIYLPCSISEHEQEYVILHEQHHIKRLDHIIKLIAFAALCVHWFNPLVWAAFILASKDMEMSCDEAVLRKLGENIRADYSASLLSLATGRRIISGTPLAFGEGDAKSRIKNLLHWKKPALWIIIVALAACIVLAVCLTTNPAKRPEVIRVNGEYYMQEDVSVTTLPEGSKEIGMLEGVYHRTSELPDKDFYAANIDEKYAGCPLYQSSAEFDVIYLEDFGGYYIPFRAESYMNFEAAIADMNNKDNVQVFDVYQVDADTVLAGFTTGNDLSMATFSKSNQGVYKLRGYREFGGASLYSMTIMQEDGIDHSITVALSSRSDLAKVTAEYDGTILEKAVSDSHAMIVFEWPQILPESATVDVRFYNADGKELERIDGPVDDSLLAQPTTIDELIPGTAYVSYQCIYMNPLSSYGASSDSGYRYIMGDDHFTMINRGSGAVSSIASSPDNKTDYADEYEHTIISKPDWKWQAFPYTDEEWNELHKPGITSFGIYNPNQMFDEILYQPITDNLFLLRVDGTLWLVELKDNPQMGTYLWSIYSLVPESAMGVAQWEYAPMLSSRLPVFRFEFDMEYTEISAACENGLLTDWDAQGSPQYEHSMTFHDPDALYWAPITENRTVVGESAIHFTAQRSDGTQTNGTIYLTSSGRSDGRRVYTASLVGAGMYLSPNTEREGAIISESIAAQRDIPAKTETIFKLNLAGNTSMQQTMEITEEMPYWGLNVVNTGTHSITIEIDGTVYEVEAGQTAYIHADKPWEVGSYPISFASVHGMEGSVVCETAPELLKGDKAVLVLHDLTTGNLEISSDGAEDYVFYTNSKQICITVRSETEFQGEITLIDVSQDNAEILFAEVSGKRDTAVFTGLTSARRYRIDCEGMDDCIVVISGEK